MRVCQVLVIYLYRINFSSLDADWLSLFARMFGLGFACWLLSQATHYIDHEHLGKLAWQLALMCLVHTGILMLLMVSVEPVEKAEKDGLMEDSHEG
mmetsp:Transcript_29029/g.47373  ORF Transcript_29029/g.47373 Transcript_29029/m.47373 type:complete len:96 (+) Transcript_29029:1-288(+)